MFIQIGLETTPERWQWRRQYNVFGQSIPVQSILVWQALKTCIEDIISDDERKVNAIRKWIDDG